jgi:Terminase RNaseH-like domain
MGARLWIELQRSSGGIRYGQQPLSGLGVPADDVIPGVIDPACLGSSQIDGRTLMEVYRRLGLELSPAVNAVEAGVTEVWNLLVSGRLKVMASLTNWLREFRQYHRDERGSGKIVKRADHLMECDPIFNRQQTLSNAHATSTGAACRVAAYVPRPVLLDGMMATPGRRASVLQRKSGLSLKRRPRRALPGGLD